jgi:uncharacterized alkaline shock family protein YloU
MATPEKEATKSEAAPTRATPTPDAPAPRRTSTREAYAGAISTTDRGKTRIADTVVAKIAALATREIPGVYSMGRGIARAMGALRARIPGASQAAPTQGVAVEVGEKQAAVDLDIVTWYGQSIVEVTEAVRDNVIERIEGMTGLEVVEVNINVDGLYVEGEEQEQEQESRVQ